MNVCRGSFSRSYGRCPVCGAQFPPSHIEGFCITVPDHEPAVLEVAEHALVVEPVFALS